jgi:hypothetical protein
MWCHLVVLIARAAYRMVTSVRFVKSKNHTAVKGKNYTVPIGPAWYPVQRNSIAHRQVVQLIEDS